MSRVIRAKNYLQEFSIPLIFGVVASMVLANTLPKLYQDLVNFQVGNLAVLGHPLTVKFIVNDLFMVLFFGIAMKEIVEFLSPEKGESVVNVVRKAASPLLATAGGVLVPALMYFSLTGLWYWNSPDRAVIMNGWGIPTATDIALAWLVARSIFGKDHPAVKFLLLLAVADDAIGLGIIAINYPDPVHPVHPVYLTITAAAMGIAWGMRKSGVTNWVAYLAVPGVMSWLGLILSSLHPALALVFIIPFMPKAEHDTGLFEEMDEVDVAIAKGVYTAESHPAHSTLDNFENTVKTFVDFGLFAFAFSNAGVAFAEMSTLTAITGCSLVFGKMLGVYSFAFAGTMISIPLPNGMNNRDLVVAGMVAGIGLTVALFVAGQAFTDTSPYQGPAKMGTVFSAGAALLAFVTARLLGIKPTKPTNSSEAVTVPVTA